MHYRPYQQSLHDSVLRSFNAGVRRHALVAPTGAGKTVMISGIIKSLSVPTCAIAHRQELVGNISLALAKNGLTHRIIGSTKTVKNVCRIHMMALGKVFYDPGASLAVASVDTLLRRADKLAKWLPTVNLWIIDECHHVLRENKWGKAVELFPNARGLGVTATLERSDGYGLGAHTDGVFEAFTEEVSMGDLIQMGFLTPFEVYGIPIARDLHFDAVPISANGDYSKKKLTEVTNESRQLVGDIVKHYKRLADGKRGITFAQNRENGRTIAEQFNAAGVPALFVDGTTGDVERFEAIEQLKNGQIKQLVNVDLFGEGVDIPAIDYVALARRTASFPLHAQQIGRAVRLFEGKTKAIISDHVNNSRLGFPLKTGRATLDRREKTSKKTDTVYLTDLVDCEACFRRYPIQDKICPSCGAGTPDIPKDKRSDPEYIEGDLVLLDIDELNSLREKIKHIQSPAEEVANKLRYAGAKPAAIMGARSRHIKRQEAQQGLRDAIAKWAGVQRHQGLTRSEVMRRFFKSYGYDIMTAQTLTANQMTDLQTRVANGTDIDL